MKLVSIVYFVLFAFGSIPEVKINDNDIQTCLNIYLDSVRNSGHEEFYKHLMLNVEQNKSGKVIYISEAPSMKWFEGNLPDAYAVYDDRHIFIFDSSYEETVEYQEFVNQFEKSFSKVEPMTIIEQMDFKSIGTYRFQIEDVRIEEVTKVEMFPDKRFYRDGLIYDDAKVLKYKDGAYHVSNLDRIIKPYNKQSDPLVDVDKQVILTKEESENCKIYLLVTIDKKGRAINVDVSVFNCDLLKSKIEELRTAIIGTKGWEIGIINDEAVCYKQSVVL